jgi:3-oxoacyl-[acyl-carrier protein] reductase
MIVVTGASGGLGQRLLDGLTDLDDVVVGTYHRHQPALTPGSRVQLHRVDVTDPESTRRFAAAIAPTATRITLLNLAGVSISRLAVDLPVGDWDQVVDVSLRGSFLMSQALLKPMIRDRWGRIINVSSVVAREGVVGTAAYAAAKAGLEGLTRTLATEYARYGILVNTLALGYFDGGMTHALSEEHRKAVTARVPLRRLGDVSDITEAVRFLVRANYVTGASLRIDGGLP